MNIDIASLTIEEILELKEKLSHVRIASRPRSSKTRAFYEALDWTKTNAQLILETKLSPATVSFWRRTLGKPKVTKHWPACLSWDWSKSNTELSRELGIEVSCIVGLRNRIGKPHVRSKPRIPFLPPPNPLTPPGRADLNGVDWSLRDSEIARRVGCSRERVRQVRAQLGMPPSQYRGRYDEFLKLVNGAKSLNSADVSSMGISLGTFARYCAKAGISRTRKPVVKKYPWHLVNWQLPTKTVADVWGWRYGIVASWRSSRGLPRPLFRSNGQITEEHKVLIDNEKAKASVFHNPIAAPAA